MIRPSSFLKGTWDIFVTIKEKLSAVWSRLPDVFNMQRTQAIRVVPPKREANFQWREQTDFLVDFEDYPSMLSMLNGSLSKSSNNWRNIGRDRVPNIHHPALFDRKNFKKPYAGLHRHKLDFLLVASLQTHDVNHQCEPQDQEARLPRWIEGLQRAAHYQLGCL